MTLAIEFVTW
ncbi:hypothetical protein D022_2410A, partial [Vibrio parahaemolyticus 12310]